MCIYPIVTTALETYSPTISNLSAQKKLERELQLYGSIIGMVSLESSWDSIVDVYTSNLVT